jgi:glycosyltransferase involved in cell wall biosynthesis
MDKKTILTISDHPLSPSGVGTQTRYMIEALLNTGNYKVISLAGAIKHTDYQPQVTEEYGEDWVIYPIDGYGTPDVIRSILVNERPDVLWFMTDPRFYGWLWMIENEIRPHVPMVYYHVWDNYPYPDYNKKYYDSNDVIVTISKVTEDIVQTVAPDVECIRLPHAVPPEFFKGVSESDIANFKKDHVTMSGWSDDKVVFFWNNRNARRKQSGTLVYWFKEFLDEVGSDKACLIMHTDPKDQYGQDLEAILKNLNITNGEVLLSPGKISPDELAMMYSLSDCTINISDAEGFGLATLESLACGTPIIVNMTGGLQEQVTNGDEWYGIGIEPSSKAIIGSQDVPYIYEDRISKEDFLNALRKIYSMTRAERKALGALGKEHVEKTFNFEKYQQGWVQIFENVTESHGSWENRKNYKTWSLEEV